MIGLGFDKRLFIIFRSATPSWTTKLGGKWSWWVSRVQAGPLWDDACWREERGPTCVQTASSRHQGQRHQTILSVQVTHLKIGINDHICISFDIIIFVYPRNGGHWYVHNTVHNKAFQLKGKATKHLRYSLPTDGWKFRINQKWRKDTDFKILETPTSPCKTIMVELTDEAKTRQPRCEGRYHAVKGRRIRGRQVWLLDYWSYWKKWIVSYPGIPERGKRRQRSLVPFYKDKQHNLVDHKQSWVRELLLAVQLCRKIMSSCTFQRDQRPCRAEELALPWRQWRTKRGGHKTVLWRSQILW